MSAMATTTSSTTPPSTPPTIAPCLEHTYFFYGSLMDPVILGIVTGTDRPIILHDATLRGYTAKLWSMYPAIVPDPNGLVQGKVWIDEAANPGTVARLQAYETNNYEARDCTFSSPDEDKIGKNGRVFVFIGNQEQLRDGKFDLEAFQKSYELED
ncbi:hypothetical protein VDGD_10290 [Verticillium dahliae]|nr:hypothetical protein VDGD_10290 [Verticillium dahliae]RXG43150.1 hypothetical protein VDGE_10290 [Verticillium dahliae]